MLRAWTPGQIGIWIEFITYFNSRAAPIYTPRPKLFSKTFRKMSSSLIPRRSLRGLTAGLTLTGLHRRGYAGSMLVSIARDGQEIGEWNEDQVRTLYLDGQLLGTDMYWHEGMDEWKTLRHLIKPALPQPAMGIREPQPMPAIPPPLQAAREDIAREPLTAVEEALAKMGPFPDGWTPATFRRRAMARMIDYFVLTVASGAVLFLILFPITLLAPSATVFLWIVILLGYPISNLLFFAWDWGWVSLTGSSPGKWLYGLRVVHSDGTKDITSRVSARRSNALLRSLWYLLAYPFFTFWRVGSAEKQYLRTGTTTWDTKAGTVVIGKKIGVFRTILAVTLTVVGFLGILVWCAAATSITR